MMRKLLVFATCMTALCLHSATTEEARQIVREYLEKMTELRKQPFVDPLYAIEVSVGLHTLDRDVRVSVCLEMMKEMPDDPVTVDQMMAVFCGSDGYNYASYGNQEALDWARIVAKNEGGRFETHSAQVYLMWKGDTRDLDIIGGKNRDLLVARVAGTNIINHVGSFWEKSWLSCVPSVTNTGPQGVYVENILRQYWEKMEADTFIFDGRPVSMEDRSNLPIEILAILDNKNVTYDGRSYTYKDKRKIPAEILTLVVWFDDDSNPVTNVDLSKYGLTMPELDIPNKGRATASRLAAEEPAATTQDDTSVNVAEDEQDVEKAKASHFWLYVVIFHLILFPSLYFMRRKFSKR